MAINPSNPSPRDVGFGTGKSQTEGFVRVDTAGVRELAKELERVAGALAAPGLLQKCVKQASRPILTGYKALASKPFAAGSGGATGNLAKSTITQTKEYEGGQVAVAITGPRQTGPVGSEEGRESGNHAWLVEFGSGRRRPGTQNRRTYVNVHQMINGKMRRTSSAMNDEEFARRSRGYYFLMGSLNEPTRQRGAGKGYSHDFASWPQGREQHPITLGPGESIEPMPAYHPMRDTIAANAGLVQSVLAQLIQAEINKF
jgi:hypothetical protein